MRIVESRHGFAVAFHFKIGDPNSAHVALQTKKGEVPGWKLPLALMLF
jgi:hypothetical protein